MKKLLLIIILFSLNQGAKSQKFLDRLTNTVNKIKGKVDSVNQKASNLKSKTDSTKASVQALRGKKDSAFGKPTNNNISAYSGPVNGTGGSSKDQLIFTLTGCVGNTASQTVTVYFTIGNPVKVNQSVTIYNGSAKAVDMDGNQCRPKEFSLANGNGSWIELPTGITTQGSVTFSNILPKESQLSIVEFNIATRDYDGGSYLINKPIALKNLAITWQ